MKTQAHQAPGKFLMVLVAGILLVAQPGNAQTTISGKSDRGKIAGKIVDAKTGETVIGANVVITGTAQGDATDIDGKYSIDYLEAGIYSVTASYISYTKKTVTNIEVEAGKVTVLNIPLEPETVGLEEVVVTATANKSGEAGLLSVQKKAAAIQDGISSEQISKSGDSNVASAIKRVSGITVADGNDVYVRGLGNRYSNIQLNGSPVPSTNPNRKEAPVDILSSGIVDNIVVQKTYTPDQTGEFSGGSVQIVTKEFPDAKNLSFSYSTSFNTVSTLSNYLGYSGSGTDFLGYDNGHRSLPEQLKDGTISSPAEAGAIASELHNSWTPRNFQAIPSQKFSLSYADQYNESKMPLGVVANFSYKMANESRPEETFRYINNYNPNDGTTLIGADYIRNSGIEKSSLNGMLNVFMKPSPNIKIGMKNLYSNSSQDKTTTIVGEYYNYRGTNNQTVLEFDRRSIYSSSLQFESYFRNFYESGLDVNVSISRAMRETPDRRNTQYIENQSGEFEVLFADRGNLHFFSDQQDQNITAKVDYRLKPVNKLTLKTGGMAVFKDRDFTAYRLLYQDLDNSFASNLRTLRPEEIFIPEYISSGNIEFVENTQQSDSYEGAQQLYAGYFSANWFISDSFSFEGGFRYESSTQELDGEVLENLDTRDFLPAANLTYRLTDRTNIRAAYSITLARPEFREVSNFNFRDFIGGRTVYGNPELKRTRIFNYDLRLETYPNSGELFAISFFYKQFKDPIELFYRITQNNEVFFDNVGQADLYGLELEARKQLTERLKLNTNFSYIISSVSYEDPSVVARQANEERPMYGQSPYTLNVGAFYLIPSADMEVNLTYNTFGARISAIGNAQQPDDEYEQPFHKLDLNMSKRFGNAGLSLGIENLLNDTVEYKQGDIITNSYEVGMTFSLGFNYSF